MKSLKVIVRRHILDFDSFSKRPKREKQKLTVSSGSAHSNFSAHSGGFKGNMSHTLFVNAQNISGTANKGRASEFIDYLCRDKECLATYGDPVETKKSYKSIEDNLLSKRKNSVIQRRLVIQLPKEFLNSAESNMTELCKQLDEKYFSVSKAFFVSLHQGGSDFRNPHLHIVFANVDNDFKNIRAYHDKDFLFSLKKDIAQFIQVEVGVDCKISEVKKPQSKHFDRWVTEAFKRAKKAEEQGDGGALMKSYMDRYTPFADFVASQLMQNSEKIIKEKENKIKEIAEKEAEKIKIMNEKIAKKAKNWLYSKKQRDEFKKDILSNNKIINNLKNKAKIDFTKEKELQRQKQTPTKDAFTQDLERRNNKSKRLER